MTVPDELQPATERISGGLSARLAAVGAAVALLSVVWFGASGRSEQPPAGPSPAAVPSASVTPRPTPTPSRPNPTPDPLPVFEAPLPGDDAFGMTAWINGRFYLSVLRESEPGHLRAAMRVPLTQSSSTAEMEIIQLWTREDRPALASVMRYELSADWLVGGSDTYRVLHDEVAARPASLDEPRMVRQGYVLNVDALPYEDHAYIIVDILMGDAPEPHLGGRLEEAPSLEARLMDGERLLAVVGLGGRPPGVMTAHVIIHQRYGPQSTLDLVSKNDAGEDTGVLASLALDHALLRRGFPEEFSGEFVLTSALAGERTWEYRVTPLGTGSGILLLIEVERQAGRQWTCWSHDQFCWGRPRTLPTLTR